MEGREALRVHGLRPHTRMDPADGLRGKQATGHAKDHACYGSMYAGKERRKRTSAVRGRASGQGCMVGRPGAIHAFPTGVRNRFPPCGVGSTTVYTVCIYHIAEGCSRWHNFCPSRDPELVDAIQDLDQLRWGQYSGFSGWVECNHMSP